MSTICGKFVRHLPLKLNYLGPDLLEKTPFWYSQKKRVHKDPIPNDLKSFLVYNTCGHFKTRIEEHIKKDNNSHIFKHLHSSETCLDSYNSLCFKIIDQGNSKFD